MDGCKFLLLLFIPASIYYLFLKFIFKVNYLFLPKNKRVMCTALCWWITHFVTPWPWCWWKSLNGTCSHIWTWLINYESVSIGRDPTCSIAESIHCISACQVLHCFPWGTVACEGLKTVKARRDGCLQGNSVFQTQPDCCSYEFTETVAIFTRPAQVQDRWGPSIERGGRYLNPNQEAISSTTDTCWKRGKKSVFGRRVSLGISATLLNRPHAQE